jgi:hypothetical protein
MITYTERDIKVSASGDLTIAPNGDLSLAEASGVLKQDIAFRIKTDFDDFTPHPEIGADLSSLIGEVNERATALIGEQKIIRSVTQDGRVARKDLVVKSMPINLDSVVYYVFIRDGMSVINVTPDMSFDINKGIISY